MHTFLARLLAALVAPAAAATAPTRHTTARRTSTGGTQQAERKGFAHAFQLVPGVVFATAIDDHDLHFRQATAQVQNELADPDRFVQHRHDNRKSQSNLFRS